MAQETETVRLKLDSGETVRVIVPKGMSDDEIHSLMQMQHPEMVPPPGAPRPQLKGLDDAPTPFPTPTPSTDLGSASGRFWSGAKAGIGGENALNTSVDPAHPISTNPMIPGAGVYRDLKGGNVAGALGRIAGPAAQLVPFAFGRAGMEPAEPGMPAFKTSKIPSKFLDQTSFSGERAGLPYQPNPRYTPRPEPAAPIPARSGLMLPEGKPAIEGVYRDATLNKRNIPEFAGEGESPTPPTSTRPSLTPLGGTRGGFPRPHLPIVATPEQVQIYQNRMPILKEQARIQGLHSAAFGKVGMPEDYPTRVGRDWMRGFGDEAPASSGELSPPSTIRPYAPDPGTRSPDFDLHQQATERAVSEMKSGSLPEGMTTSGRAQQILDELKKAQ